MVQETVVAPSAASAPIKTSLEKTTLLVANAAKWLKAYNAHTERAFQAAEDKLAPLVESYYAPIATRVAEIGAPLIENADAKLAPIVETCVCQATNAQARAQANLAVAQAKAQTIVDQARDQKTKFAAYSATVATNVQTNVTSVVEQGQAYSAVAVKNARVSADNAKATLSTTVAKTQEALLELLAVMAKYEAEIEARLPFSAALRARVVQLLLAAQELSAQGRSVLRANMEPSRKALHARLEFVATELEARLVKGDNVTAVEIDGLVGRVRALVDAATETCTALAAKGARNLSTLVGPAAALTEAPADRAASEEELFYMYAPVAASPTPSPVRPPTGSSSPPTIALTNSSPKPIVAKTVNPSVAKKGSKGKATKSGAKGGKEGKMVGIMETFD